MWNQELDLEQHDLDNGIARYIDALKPKFYEFDNSAKALIDLHASLLREATEATAPENYLPSAGIVFGLVRVLQRGSRPVPNNVLLTAAAHAVRAARPDRDSVDRKRQLELGQSWLAHASLIARAA